MRGKLASCLSAEGGGQIILCVKIAKMREKFNTSGADSSKASKFYIF
jgi:hypothetical protein